MVRQKRDSGNGNSQATRLCEASGYSFGTSISRRLSIQTADNDECSNLELHLEKQTYCADEASLDLGLFGWYPAVCLLLLFEEFVPRNVWILGRWYEPSFTCQGRWCKMRLEGRQMSVGGRILVSQMVIA